jgi:DNA-binding transcriptional MerR regulator
MWHTGAVHGVDRSGQDTVPQGEPALVEDGEAPELSLEELVTRSGVSVRTIRFYQSSGVLPKPRRVGREVRYREEHLARLRVIAELQERGLKLGAIRELVGRTGGARDVGAWLGFDEALRDPWTGDRPQIMTLAEVHDRLGDRPLRLAGDLADAGLLERQDDGTFLVPSPALLDLGLRLLDTGVSVDVANRAAGILRDHLAGAADGLVELFAAETGRTFAGSGTPEDVAAALTAVRPIALDAAGLLLAHEMERALRRLAASVPSRGTRRR